MSEKRMPAIFFGHGSPMNAVEDNEFSAAWERLGRELPRPRAILCVSAHWLTEGSPATAMERPRTIHDFGGFPRELYEVSYPAPGDPELAAEAAAAVAPALSGLDYEWGLDHGTWSVLRRVYPEADIPIVQLGIDIEKPAEHHYELGKRLRPLRDRGVMIVGSGNIVHNLRMIAWDRMAEDGYAFPWARSFDEEVRRLVAEGRDDALIDCGNVGRSGGAARGGDAELSRATALSIPTPDHYYPFLYALGARDPAEGAAVFNAKAVGGSLTMTSFVFGLSKFVGSI